MESTKKVTARLMPIISGIALFLVMVATSAYLLLPDETREPIIATNTQSEPENNKSEESNLAEAPIETTEISSCELNVAIDDDSIISRHESDTAKTVEISGATFDILSAGDTNVYFYCGDNNDEQTRHGFAVSIDEDLTAEVTRLDNDEEETN